MARIPFWKTPLTEEQKELVYQNRGLAYKIANKLFNQNPHYSRYGTIEDLQQEALFILCRCARKFDPTKSKISTYCSAAIPRGLWGKSVGDGIIHIPAHSTSKREIDASEYKDDIERAMRVVFDSVISASANQGEGDLRDNSEGIFGAVGSDISYSDLRTDIREAMSKISPESRRILRWVFWKGKTLEWIGKKLNLSKERARQLKVTAFMELKGFLGRSYDESTSVDNNSDSSNGEYATSGEVFSSCKSVACQKLPSRSKRKNNAKSLSSGGVESRSSRRTKTNAV